MPGSKKPAVPVQSSGYGQKKKKKKGKGGGITCISCRPRMYTHACTLCPLGKPKYSDRDDGEVLVDKVCVSEFVGYWSISVGWVHLNCSPLSDTTDVHRLCAR